MSATTPAWVHERPFRNWNPLDLRPRAQPPKWPGQTALDTAPGGPFAIFASIADGWAAGGLWLMMAHDLWGLVTPRKMITTFAPWTENNTDAYIATVCKPLGITGDTPVNPHDPMFRRAMLRAMAHVEDYKVVWEAAPLDSGNLLADARWTQFRADYLVGQAVSPRGRVSASVATVSVAAAEEMGHNSGVTADDLMRQELQEIEAGKG